MGPMRPTVVVSSRLGRTGSLLVAVLAAAALLLELVTGGPWAALRALPWLALVALLAHLLWGSARLVLGPDELVLDNPTARFRLPWAAVEAAESRWGLVVLAAGRRWKAWAAPARGGLAVGYGSRRPGADLAQAVPDYAVASPRDIQLDLDARAAAQLVGEQAAVRRAPDGPTAIVVERRWGRLALLGLVATLCVLTLLR